MLKGITESGYKYEIDEARLTDWRVMKKLAKLKDLESDDISETEAMDFITIMADIEELLFKDGGKGFEKAILKKHNGIVAPAVALKELLTILKSHQPTKN